MKSSRTRLRGTAIVAATVVVTLGVAACSADNADNSDNVAEPSLNEDSSTVETTETVQTTVATTVETTVETTTDATAPAASVPESWIGSGEGFQLMSAADYTGVSDAVMFEATLGQRTTTCVMSEESVTCLGAPDDSVPNLEDMPDNEPFTGRPSGATVSADGLTWSVFEGVPPAPRNLKPGQRLEVGNSWCQLPDKDHVECGNDGNAMSLSAPDLLVTSMSESE